MGAVLLAIAAVGFAGAPAHADNSGAVAAAAQVDGWWGNGLTTTPTNMTVGFGARITGTLTVAPGVATAVGDVCSASGSGQESVQAGSGIMSLSCVGQRFSLASSGGLLYQRLGTTLVLTGSGVLRVNGVSATVPLRLELAIAPSDVWLPNTGAQLRNYRAAGSLTS